MNDSFKLDTGTKVLIKIECGYDKCAGVMTKIQIKSIVADELKEGVRVWIESKIEVEHLPLRKKKKDWPRRKRKR